MLSDTHKSKHRRSIRIKDYDYSQPGMYFVTICCHKRQSLFGEILDGEVKLNRFGQVAEKYWQDIAGHFNSVEIHKYIVMPNHIHGILSIHTVRARHVVPLPVKFSRPVSGSLPTIIRSNKSAVTKQINILRNTPGGALWRGNYYEHIIRNETSYLKIAEYILNNPLNWRADEYFAY